MVTGIGTVNQPQSAGVITSTSTIGNQSVIQGTPAGSVESSMPPRRTNDNRRSNKPIMEKRRRARINNCLNELKTLILDAMKKDPARHSKLEKADILEMTVKHLENLQRQQVAMTAAADPSVINKFRAGFSECASEVGRFPGLEPTVKRRLLQHLANCLQVGVGTIQTTNNNNNNNNNTTNHNNNIIINKQQQSMESTTPILATQAVTNQQQPTTIAPSVITTAQTTTTQSVQLHILPTQNDQFIHHNGIFFTNGNGTGVQLLPTRLPNGDIALVLPTSIQTTTAAPTMQQQQQHHQQSVPQKQPQPTQQQIIYQRTTLSPSQQSQNSHSNSTSPLPMLIPIPTRTASASSVASSSSGVSSMPQQTNSIPSPQSSSSSSPNHYMSPNSPQHYQQHRYEPMDTTPSSPHHHQNGVIHRYSPPMSKPLSLVIRKTSQPEEEKPWRPW